MTNTDLATTTAAKPPVVILRERLQQRYGELKAALPSDISPEQFIRALMTSVAINQDLLACNWNSLWLACMRACRDGLLPDGVEGAMVPYKSTVTWVPMYQGLLRRFRKSGNFKWITADVVRQGEEFTHFIDENGEHFRHVPGDNVDAPLIKIYAMAHTKDGGIFVAVMPIAEANKIRAMSKSTRDDAPWKMWPGEMYKKTALRRLSKMLPTARDLPTADDLLESGEEVARLIDDAGPIAPETTTSEQQQTQEATAADVGASLDQFAAAKDKKAGADERNTARA